MSVIACDSSEKNVDWIPREKNSIRLVISEKISMISKCDSCFVRSTFSSSSAVNCPGPNSLPTLSQQNSQGRDLNPIMLPICENTSIRGKCALADQSYQYEAPGVLLHGEDIWKENRNVFLSSLNQFSVIKILNISIQSAHSDDITKLFEISHDWWSTDIKHNYIRHTLGRYCSSWKCVGWIWYRRTTFWKWNKKNDFEL